MARDKASLYTEYINEKKKKTHFVFMVQRDVPSRLTIHSCLAIQRSDEAVNTPSNRRLKGNSTDGGTDEPTAGLTVALLQNCASSARTQLCGSVTPCLHWLQRGDKVCDGTIDVP